MAKDRVLSPALADPFEPYLQVMRDKRRLQVMQAVQFAIILVLSVGIFYVAMTPPLVIIKDRAHGEAPIISRMGTSVPITEQDARIFFLNMIKLRYGWSSLTVHRDLKAYMGQSLSLQRDREEEHLQEVLHPGPGDDWQPRRRLEAWIAEGITNTLVLPEDIGSIRCLAQEDGAWVCDVRGKIRTQRQLPPFLDPVPEKEMVFMATLFPVRHTVSTPYGLVLARLEAFDPPTGARGPR